MDKLELNNQRLDASVPAKSTSDNMNAANISPEQYGAELHAHYQAYVDWAISNWPVQNGTLSRDAFSQSRAELDAIRAGLSASGRGNTPAAGNDPSTPGAPQFVPVDPMPWP